MDDLSRYEVIRQNVEEVHGLPRGYLHSIVNTFRLWTGFSNLTLEVLL